MRKEIAKTLREKWKEEGDYAPGMNADRSLNVIGHIDADGVLVIGTDMGPQSTLEERWAMDEGGIGMNADGTPNIVGFDMTGIEPDRKVVAQPDPDDGTEA